MKSKSKTTGTALSVPEGLACGVLSALGITLAGTIIMAYILEKQILSWENTGYGVMILIMLSSWLGALVASIRTKRQKFIVCISCGMLYFIVLLMITALFFGGMYSGVGETALLILCGNILAVLTMYGEKNGRKKKKYRTYNG